MDEVATAVWSVLRHGAPIFSWDAASATMLGLIGFIGFIIMRYSQAYLHGDAGKPRYTRWLWATLSSVTVLVLSNHLVLLALAWMATSLSLHQLLTFYPQRPQALIAAHKKFIVSRSADACLLGAIALIHLNVGSFEIDELNAWARSMDVLPKGVQIATVLLVVGAALKSAQLPFHGWLVQVMEAPTPVSALLHAGVVNLGGFLMIRLAPLMVRSDVAQCLLVVIGTVTATVAALIMTTRVSIKVALAWSTCAQMGFMLVQCGLGAYQLALLHIVAHSLYKAHAFLSSGSTVEVWRARTLMNPRRPVRLAHWLLAAGAALVGVTSVGIAFGVNAYSEPNLWALGWVLSLALTPLLVSGSNTDGRRLVFGVAASMGVATLYFAWHAVFSGLTSFPARAESSPLRLGIVIVGFGTLFALQTILVAYPKGGLTRRLYQPLFAGLYLDEIFTRLTFYVWPPKLPPRQTQTSALHVAETLES